MPQAEQLLSETFLVITGTVAVYGIGGKFLAGWLDSIKPDPQGVVFYSTGR